MSPILAAVLPMLSLNNGLGLTPAMGWNSWNPIRCEGLNQKAIFEIADAMAAGMVYNAAMELFWTLAGGAAGCFGVFGLTLAHGPKCYENTLLDSSSTLLLCAGGGAALLYFSADALKGAQSFYIRVPMCLSLCLVVFIASATKFGIYLGKDGKKNRIYSRKSMLRPRSFPAARPR